MDFYPWVVIAHVFFVVIAFGAHGTSAFAMFQAKRERDRARLAAVLDLSSASLAVAGIGLILAVLLGIAAAVMGDHFSRLWPWASIVVVVVIFGVMTPIGANPMSALRKTLGISSRADKKGETPRAGTEAEVRAAQEALRPGLLATLGIVALAILVWLMELKPF